MVSVLCIFAVAARTLALVEGQTFRAQVSRPFVATRTLALIEGYKATVDGTLAGVATRTLALVATRTSALSAQLCHSIILSDFFNSE